MNNISDLPNIGKELAGKLTKCNITSPNQLKSIGSRTAFAKIHLIDSGICLNALYALEGAVQGIRWHHLNIREKAELKEFYKTIKG